MHYRVSDPPWQDDVDDGKDEGTDCSLGVVCSVRLKWFPVDAVDSVTRSRGELFSVSISFIYMY